MSGFQLTTPVALMIFNRPDTTQRVLAAIARAKPKKLLVVGDGARAGRPGEAAKVAATRSLIDGVNWDCEVLTNFSDVNLGCRRRMSSGIDWIFDMVEDAIILEDDCLPDDSFFRYCEELLNLYRQDQRIGHINGANFHFGRRINDDSYYYSKYSHIWGWASWRDRWQKYYDVDMKHWPRIRDDGRLADIFGCRAEQAYWTGIFESTFRGDIDTWDYQWVFACMLQGFSSALPNVNLVSNIGFGPEATHTSEHCVLANMASHAMQFPLRHPIGQFQCRTLDARFFDTFLRVPIRRRVGRRIRRLIQNA